MPSKVDAVVHITHTENYEKLFEKKNDLEFPTKWYTTQLVDLVLRNRVKSNFRY